MFQLRPVNSEQAISDPETSEDFYPVASRLSAISLRVQGAAVVTQWQHANKELQLWPDLAGIYVLSKLGSPVVH